MGTPFRIDFKPLGCVPDAVIWDHIAKSESVPHVEKSPPHSRKLAIVGGGPSIAGEVDALKMWDGDIWAINGAASYLKERGIKSVLITVDPSEMPDSMMDGADTAILASSANPKVFESLAGRVQKFHMSETHADGICGGCTTASRVPALAIYMGYSDVTFFGCEGSFVGNDHAYCHESKPEQVIIRIAGKDYRTYPEMLIQSQSLSNLVSTFPDAFKERSGGLLRAMVEHPDTWEIVAVSEALKRHLEAVNGDTGMYSTKFEIGGIA